MKGHKYNWPEGKRIAVMVAFDVDGELLWLQRNEENVRHLTNLSRGRYSTLQAVPRILRMLEEMEIRTTFFTPAWIAEQYPEVVKAIADAGHEIGYHGWMHEAYDSYEKEVALMDKVDKIYSDILGKIPVGNRGPLGNVYDFDVRLWVERGYVYSSNWRDSDGPFIHELDGKRVPLVELPKDSIFDDTCYDLYTECEPVRINLRGGREICEVWKDEFDSLAKQGRMMNLVMHPQFMGRPHNLRPFRELLQYMKEQGAWFATNEEVARFCLREEGMETGSCRW